MFLSLIRSARMDQIRCHGSKKRHDDLGQTFRYLCSHCPVLHCAMSVQIVLYQMIVLRDERIILGQSCTTVVD